MDEPITPISWRAPEYEQRTRGRDWYLSLGIIGASLAVVAFILDNFLFGIFIILGLATAMLFAKRPPQTISCAINDQGISAGDRHYLFEDIDSFDVHIYSKTEGRIFVQLRRQFMPLITIPIAGSDPETIKTELLKRLQEKELDETLLEKLLHYLGI
jgi:hypothetical protein